MVLSTEQLAEIRARFDDACQWWVNEEGPAFESSRDIPTLLEEVERLRKAWRSEREQVAGLRGEIMDLRYGHREWYKR